MSGHELRQAFEQSSREWTRVDETGLAKYLTLLGYHVVLVEFPIFCPRTDAILGSEVSIHARLTDKEEAEKIVEDIHQSSYGEVGAWICDITPPEPVAELSSDQLLFWDRRWYEHDDNVPF